jgi:ATP-dependent helicase/nuclease subunit A
MAAEPGQAGTLDSRLLGSATHLVIAALDLHRPVTRDAIETAIEKLVADGALSTTVAAQIDKDSILTFFQANLGRLALDAENRVHREWPFTFALPASEWHPTPDIRHTRYDLRDTIVVQGIIDMLIRTPQGLIVIDFKTDNITAGQATHRAELYRGQLDLYARAASAILKTPTARKSLYFLAPRRAVEIR